MKREVLAKEMKKIMKTGKIYLGMRQAERAIKNGEAKLLIVANNAPEVPEASVPIIKLDGDGFELGALCGKPFSVAIVTVVSEGEGKLSSMVK
ncbi:MAG: 50S ribosomal protein L30e [Euryarchaeota archaeon]|nr:50S ribosomal protein L30e [Euryarchaeota archaeon]